MNANIVIMKTMKRTQEIDYQKVFFRLAVKHLPHHIALLLSAKTHTTWLVNRLNRYAEEHFIRPSEIIQFTNPEQLEYKTITAGSALWHGTGRYKRNNGARIDILTSILEAGSLTPVEDVYAILSGNGTMESISLTRLRIIARSYADMFGKGFQEKNRYGDALMWNSYYYGLFYARTYGLHYPTLKKNYARWHALAHDKNGHTTWGKKVNVNAKNVWDIFGLGSDIEDNYPIIFGIQNITDIALLSPVFRAYEVRVNRKILLQEINHIEVPASKVADVKTLLGQFNIDIPVVSIELGECLATKDRFSKLVGLTD